MTKYARKQASVARVLAPAGRDADPAALFATSLGKGWRREEHQAPRDI